MNVLCKLCDITLFTDLNLLQFLESSLHVKMVHSDAIAPVDRILHQFVNPELISILVSCESKLGLLYSHASVDWRRFQQLSISAYAAYFSMRLKYHTISSICRSVFFHAFPFFGMYVLRLNFVSFGFPCP